MTRRAIILGALAAILIASLGYLNDTVARLNFLVGNHFPILVFGGLFLFVMLVNPLLRRLLPAAELAHGELAVIVALALMACAIPGSGLMRKFTQTVALPSHFYRQTPGWTANKILATPPTPAPSTPSSRARRTPRDCSTRAPCPGATGLARCRGGCRSSC
ncbi:MAG: hypothetical protein NT031_17945 [Planctomycetota bacterium]|nr:hypothetical protein [Planctomycetota bacterium]